MTDTSLPGQLDAHSRQVTTPCCGATVHLSVSPFRHRGYPTANDRTTERWNLPCPTCGGYLSVWWAVRVVRRYEIGWGTYALLYGAPWWTDTNGRPTHHLSG